jgi:hypothetical protein
MTDDEKDELTFRAQRAMALVPFVKAWVQAFAAISAVRTQKSQGTNTITLPVERSPEDRKEADAKIEQLRRDFAKAGIKVEIKYPLDDLPLAR